MSCEVKFELQFLRNVQEAVTARLEYIVQVKGDSVVSTKSELRTQRVSMFLTQVN